MAMTSAEALQFYEERMDQNLDAAAVAKASADFFLYGRNLDGFVKYGLIVGLSRWRCGLGDPRASFERTVSTSAGFLAALAELDPAEKAWKHHRFELTDYLRVLLGWPVDAQRLRDCLGSALPKGRELEVLGNRLLDMAVLLRLLTAECWPFWDQILESRAKVKRSRLFASTYSDYWQLLSALETGDIARAGQVAEELATLYQERKRNGYYSDSVQYEGGGPDNDNVLDFRLAVILKSYADRGVSPKLPEGFVHLWRV